MAATLHRNERGHRGGRRRALAEINVAPLLTVGVPVDLPKTKAQTLGQEREPLAVTVKRDGSIYLQNTPIAQDELVAKLTAIAANGYDQRIFVRGDKAVDYGRVMQVMGLLSAAGFTHIGLVTDVAKPKPGEN